MSQSSLLFIFIDSFIINNIVLMVFLGICPFLGVSGKLDTAARMGAAVIFVLLVSSSITYGLNLLLIKWHAEYLRIISYIVVIAATVQLVEMFIKKTSPGLFRALGIYLPLITTNCCVLGVAMFQTLREYNFAQSMVFSLGTGLGFTLALVIMAGIREQLNFADVPSIAKGTGIALMVAGILSMAFMGFAGLGAT